MIAILGLTSCRKSEGLPTTTLQFKVEEITSTEIKGIVTYKVVPVDSKNIN